MKALIHKVAFPTLRTSVESELSEICATGELSPAMATDHSAHGVDVRMAHILYLVENQRNGDAAILIDSINYNSELLEVTPLFHAWLWLVRMSIFIEKNDTSLAIDSAERALKALSEIEVKKGEDFLAILASLLYNLARVHNKMLENSRATKELTKSQQLFERLTKKNEQRFSAMLLYTIEASTTIISSRREQHNILTYYQAQTEEYLVKLEKGGEAAEAMAHLVESLHKQGEVLLQMGSARDAVKYLTKALRYQKKISSQMGRVELTLSISLAKALLRLVNRRDAAEQLLQSLLPLARRIGATEEAIEIEELLKLKLRTGSIMSLLKGIF